MEEFDLSLGYARLLWFLVFAEPTVDQYFLKNIGDITSGPGALRGLIYIKASLISTSSYTLVRSKLISSEKCPCKESSTPGELDVPCSMKRVFKWSIMVWSLASFSLQFFFTSFILWMAFFFHLCDVLEWKYFVYRSPSISQRTLDSWCQSNSSCSSLLGHS